MKIIIAGAGEVGLHLTKMLNSEKHNISLIDTREERLKLVAAELDIHTFKGSVTSIDMLSKAGAENSDLFISVTSSEQSNITSAILAKKMGARKCLARIDNLEYLEDDKREHFTQLGIDYMFYPEQLAAVEIANLIQQSASADSMSFAGGKLSLFVIRMEENAPAINQPISDMYNLSRNPEFKIVGIVRNEKTFIPSDDEKLIDNDLALTITTQRGVELLVKNFGKKTENIRSVMILGGSRTGINTAKQLAMKQTVKLIEKDRTKSYELSNSLIGTLVINGDGRNIDLLKAEGIEHTDAFIAVTGDPEINMIACLLAKRLGVKKTFAEIENSEYIKLAENMEIDTVFNKKVFTASKIFSFTMNDDVSSVKCLTCTDSEILEYMVKPESKVTHKPLKEICLPAGAIIGGIVRGKDAIIPDDEFQIRPFDKVIVFAMPDAINKVGKYFTSQERFF
jgi:trk system potassium uptake protein TrkA